jgi:hypothetical protein
VRLILVPATEENNERLPIPLRWRDSSQRDETTEGYYKKFLLEVLSSVAGKLGKGIQAQGHYFERDKLN